MERAGLMARGELIVPEHLPNRVRKGGDEAGIQDSDSPSGRRIEDVERTLILNTLRELSHNRTETAKRLGISRRALQYKLRRYADQGHAIEPE